MTEAMKHRLIGATVLVALGVIAWPVIFDTSPVREISQRSQIPEEPVIERFTVPEPQRPQLPAESAEGPEQETVTDAAPIGGEREAPAVTTAKPAPALKTGQLPPVPGVAVDGAGLPLQWAVQLGVFSQLANARDMQQRARAAGFHAILQSSSVAGVGQYRVYVDPKLDRNGAASVAAEVKRKLGVDGFVTRYHP